MAQSMVHHPERVKYANRDHRNHIQPFQGRNGSLLFPRVLPWAKLFNAFGVPAWGGFQPSAKSGLSGTDSLSVCRNRVMRAIQTECSPSTDV